MGNSLIDGAILLHSYITRGPRTVIANSKEKDQSWFFLVASFEIVAISKDGKDDSQLKQRYCDDGDARKRCWRSICKQRFNNNLRTVFLEQTSTTQKNIVRAGFVHFGVPGGEVYWEEICMRKSSNTYFQNGDCIFEHIQGFPMLCRYHP